MSTTNENTEAAETEIPESAADSSAANDTEPTTPEAEPGSKAGRDAAKYRRQLREVEAERDALRGQVEPLQKTILEAHLSDVLAEPNAFWLSGAQPSDYLDPHGDWQDDESKSRMRADAKSWRTRVGGTAPKGVAAPVPPELQKVLNEAWRTPGDKLERGFKPKNQRD